MKDLDLEKEFELKVRFALLEDFQFYENVSIEVKNGIISRIEHGKQGNFPSLILIPPLVNAHIHSGDAYFPDLGYNLTLEELVKPPSGLKHIMLEKIDKKILKASRIKWIKNILSFGHSIVADFVEGGYEGVSEATEKFLQNYIILGRPSKINIEEELDKLYNVCDGLGIPDSFTYDKNEMILIKEKFKDKPIHIHVSETKINHDNRDFWLALEYLDPIAFVHCTHLTIEEIREIKNLNKFAVLCPRSNLWFNVGFPDLISFLKEEVNVAIGTDNLAWVSPNIWKELEMLILYLRKYDKNDYSKEIFKWATLNGHKLFNFKGGIIKEKFPADFIIINNDKIELEKSYNKLLTLIKRMDVSHIVDVYINGMKLTNN
jgi:cytosine/adenosine deaminase-related metal-dependent hydrolase